MLILQIYSVWLLYHFHYINYKHVYTAVMWRMHIICSFHLEAKQIVSSSFTSYRLSYIASSFWIMANFVLDKFRPTHSSINLCYQPVGSKFVWTSGPTTCFLLKINHHLWVVRINRGSIKIGLYMFSALWENTT